MPITLPPPPARKLTPSEAAGIAKRGRKLLRRGLLTHRQYVLLDTLLWSCRHPKTGAIVVSYTKLTSLCHQARETIAAGLRTLEGLGILERIKRRVRQTWANGGVSSRQATNAYTLCPVSDTEFGGTMVPIGQEILTYVQQEAPEAVTAARDALDRIATHRQAERAAVWLGKRQATTA
jgi:hypothetical protein